MLFTHHSKCHLGFADNPWCSCKVYSGQCAVSYFFPPAFSGVTHLVANEYPSCEHGAGINLTPTHATLYIKKLSLCTDCRQ